MGTRIDEGALAQLGTRLIETSPNLLAVLDAGGVIRHVNPALLAELGHGYDDLVGRPVSVLLPEIDTTAPRPGDTARVATHAWRRDGTRLPADATFFRVPVGTELWTAVTIVDTTAHLASEDRILALSRAYRTLAHTTQVALNAHTEQELFDEVCEIGVDVGGYLHALVARPRADGSVEVVSSFGVFGGFAAELGLSTDPRAAKGDGPLARALRDGVPQYEPDFGASPRTAAMRCLVDRFGVRASAALPLRRGDEVVAALALYSVDAAMVAAPLAAMLESMAANVSVALAGIDSARRLREAAAARAELLERLVTAREQERLRIAEDVHDHSLQGLSAIDLRLTLLERLARQNRADLPTSAGQLRELVGNVTRDLRQLIYELRPTDVSQGLAGTLRAEAAYIFDATQIRWSLDAGRGTELRGLSCAQAVRIAKEALLNVRAHARATRVEIELERVADGVQVTVHDDGHGIDPQRLASPRGHCGIDTMRERAEVAGGWWHAEVAPDGGTVVRFWLPDAHAL